MNDIMKDMFVEFDFNEKPEELISDVNGIKLPDDYLDFMSEHNGGEGPLGENNYGRFFKLEELEAINDEYDVQRSWPGYAVIGGIDDTLWAYNPSKGIYCQIDSCNTGEDTYYTISDSFEEFLIKMDEELA
ncbi:MAG: SMI1/KNR4 family protein [Mogibacterium sp.]|nr:SMI1/KNR4 family protein [Mogibacterium sp.]